MIRSVLLAAASAAAMEIPVPVEPSGADIALAPNAAVRSATIASLRSPSAAPRSMRFLCMVFVHWGETRNCFPAGGAPPPASWADFDRQGRAFANAMADPAADEVTKAAFERVGLNRFRPEPNAAQSERRAVILTETVSAADALPPPPPAERIARTEITLVEDSGTILLSSLYPLRALRDERMARVTAICRVGSDRRLQCRDGAVVLFGEDRWSSEAQEAALAREFLLTTYQAASLFTAPPTTRDGRDTAGLDVEFVLTWALPR